MRHYASLQLKDQQNCERSKLKIRKNGTRKAKTILKLFKTFRDKIFIYKVSMCTIISEPQKSFANDSFKLANQILKLVFKKITHFI